MNIKVKSGAHEVVANFGKEEAETQNNQKVAVSINGVDFKEDSARQQVEDKETKYFGMNPWDIYQARKDNPDFGNC